MLNVNKMHILLQHTSKFPLAIFTFITLFSWKDTMQTKGHLSHSSSWHSGHPLVSPFIIFIDRYQ